MENCIVEKFIGEVNDTFPKLGVFELKAANNNFSVFYLTLNGTEKLKVADGHFTNSAGTADYGDNMNKTGATGYLYISADSILSLNVYSITSIILIPQGGASVCTTDTMQLSHCINCTYIEIQGGTSGDIAWLAKLSALTTLNIGSTSISGNLENLLENKNTLRTIVLPSTVVYTEETLQEFVDAGCSVTGGTLIES